MFKATVVLLSMCLSQLNRLSDNSLPPLSELTGLLNMWLIRYSVLEFYFDGADDAEHIVAILTDMFDPPHPPTHAGKYVI